MYDNNHQLPMWTGKTSKSVEIPADESFVSVAEAKPLGAFAL